MHTSDLCDENDDVTVFPVPLVAYGKVRQLDGLVETVRVGDSNQAIRELLATPGNGRVLLVDGGGARAKFALVGDRLAQIAINNGWHGIVVDGLVRDVDSLAGMEIGVWARGTWPKRGPVDGSGTKNVALEFGDVVVAPGDRIVCDSDGLVIVASGHRGPSE